MDALADVLKTIRLHASTYFCRDFTPTWGMDIEHSHNGSFHIIVEGECWVKLPNSANPIHMVTGDIVAFPTGGAHWISDRPETKRICGKTAAKQIIAGDNPFNDGTNNASSQTLLCGAFNYDSSITHPFLRDLPCFIHIQTNQNPELTWLKELVLILSRESKNPSPGSSVIIDRLTEVLFIQILRTYVQREHEQLDYMTALSDAKIGPTLNLIHAEEHADWSVEKLANEAALSRSAFTERFIKHVGETPKTYLINWRMQKAKSKLKDADMSMFEIAESAGYSSEAAFSKAFKQYFSHSPGAFRKHQNELNNASPAKYVKRV